MQKTRELEVQEAYAQGFKDCKNEMNDLIERIDKFQAAPETELAYWLQVYFEKKMRQQNG